MNSVNREEVPTRASRSARCWSQCDFSLLTGFPFLRQRRAGTQKKGIKERSFFSVTEVEACVIIIDGELSGKAHDFAKELTQFRHWMQQLSHK